MRQLELIVTDSRISKPQYATTGAAALDLRACIDAPITLWPGDQRSIETGIRISIGDPYTAAMLLPRSGLGCKGLILANGTGLIDSDYQGPIIAVVLNRSTSTIQINPLDRICQMVFIDVKRPTINVVQDFTATTARGQSGLGSTGVK